MKYREALRARIAAATKGPLLEREDHDYYQGGTYIGVDPYYYADGMKGAGPNAAGAFEFFETNVARIEMDNDKPLLMHARADLERLLSLLERAEKALDAMGEWERTIRGWNPVSPALALRHDALAALRAELDREEP